MKNKKKLEDLKMKLMVLENRRTEIKENIASLPEELERIISEIGDLKYQIVFIETTETIREFKTKAKP
jgi:predicted  nucleic acid-binding Zn-ribbon protein